MVPPFQANAFITGLENQIPPVAFSHRPHEPCIIGGTASKGKGSEWPHLHLIYSLVARTVFEMWG